MYAKTIILFLFSFGLVASDNFFKKTDARWKSAFNYRIQKEKSELLFEIDFYGKNMGVVTDCIFLKERSKDKAGRIFVTEKKEAKCLSSKNIIAQKELFNFKYNFQKKQLVLYIDKEKQLYSFLNYGKRQKALYASALKETLVRGLQVGGNVVSSNIKEYFKDGVICKKIEADCSYSIKKDCSRCKSASYKIIDSMCMDDYTEICGEDKCGQKNGPACIRGYKTANADPRLYCIADSPFGFCSKGLRVFCENGILVCK